MQNFAENIAHDYIYELAEFQSFMTKRFTIQKMYPLMYSSSSPITNHDVAITKVDGMV